MRGVILCLTKSTSHMLNKALKQCASLLKWLWLRRVVVSRPPPHYREYRGTFAQPKARLLYIIHQRHQTWQARLFSHYQQHCWTQGPWLRITVYETHTTNSHDYSREWKTSVWARALNLSNIIVIQCPIEWKKKKKIISLALITSRIVDGKYNQL